MPPIGVMPGWIWQDKVRNERINELLAAMLRYCAAGLPIKEDWLIELSQLIQASRVKPDGERGEK